MEVRTWGRAFLTAVLVVAEGAGRRTSRGIGRRRRRGRWVARQGARQGRHSRRGSCFRGRINGLRGELTVDHGPGKKMRAAGASKGLMDTETGAPPLPSTAAWIDLVWSRAHRVLNCFGAPQATVACGGAAPLTSADELLQDLHTSRGRCGSPNRSERYS
jgi:hypothetical protein